MAIDADLLLRAAGPIAGGAWLWLQYFDLKDSLRPEPRRLLVLAFVLGAAAAALAAGGYVVAAWLGFPSNPDGGALLQALYCLGVVGPVEEGAKFLVAAAVLFRMRHFDEPIDGLVYASAVSIGFASAENFVYAHFLTWWEHLLRVLATPLIHSLFSALWGFGAGYALLSMPPGRRRYSLIAGSLAGSMLAHGLYDAAVVAFDARWLAGTIALAIWIWVIVEARRAVRRRR